MEVNWTPHTPANRAACFLWLAGYAGTQHAVNYLCLAAGCLGTYLCWWSVELDHRLGGDYPIIWQTLGDIGNVLRAIPLHHGVPIHPFPDF